MSIERLEAIKDTCIAALRGENAEEFDNALNEYEKISAENENEAIFKLDSLGMIACLALKAENLDAAQKALNLLYTSVLSKDLLGAEEECFWKNMRYVACMAARTHSKEVFVAVVSKLAVLYANKKDLQGSYDNFCELLKVLLFTAVDRRYTEVMPMLQWLGLKLAVTGDGEFLADFLREWACMAAQATRRGWAEVSVPLLNGLLRFLIKQRNFELTRKLMLYIAMHMQMLSAWDGVEKVLRYYEPMQTFSLIVLKRASKEKDVKEQIRWTRLVLRWWRDFIAASARHTLSDETEVYQIWYKFTQEKLSEKRFLHVSLLQQMTVAYWAMTQPRTTKRRLDALQDITNPNLLSDEHYSLLNNLR